MTSILDRLLCRRWSKDLHRYIPARLAREYPFTKAGFDEIRLSCVACRHEWCIHRGIGRGEIELWCRCGRDLTIP